MNLYPDLLNWKTQLVKVIDLLPTGQLHLLSEELHRIARQIDDLITARRQQQRTEECDTRLYRQRRPQ